MNQIPNDTIERLWGIDPSSVYGALLVVMALFIFLLVYFIYLQRKELKENRYYIIEMNKHCIEAILTVKTAVGNVETAITTLGEEIKEIRTHVFQSNK